jgi:hypothetical protein
MFSAKMAPPRATQSLPDEQRIGQTISHPSQGSGGFNTNQEIFLSVERYRVVSC